ncbi:MAG: hypothetical protein J2P21_12655 [Chloracidobacterium sp.]|nr:hypothetical protein [Chloracidobacterium sp.]
MPCGQAIQAARPLEGQKETTGIEVEFPPIKPTLPGLPQDLQRIKYARTVVNTMVTLILLIVRLPRFDIAQVYAAAYFSFLLAPAPAILIAKLYGKRVIFRYHSGEAGDRWAGGGGWPRQRFGWRISSSLRGCL